MPFLKYKRSKLKLRVFLAGHSVAMVTYSDTKIIPTCSTMIGQIFDAMIIASTDKQWQYWPIKIYVLESAETVLSHLKVNNSHVILVIRIKLVLWNYQEIPFLCLTKGLSPLHTRDVYNSFFNYDILKPSFFIHCSRHFDSSHCHGDLMCIMFR